MLWLPYAAAQGRATPSGKFSQPGRGDRQNRRSGHSRRTRHPRVGALPERRDGPRAVVPHNVRVSANRGRGNTLRSALLSAAVTGTVVAWGLLVFAAIDFGGKARKRGARQLVVPRSGHHRRDGVHVPRDPAREPVAGRDARSGTTESPSADHVRRWQARRQARRSLRRHCARRDVVQRSRFGP